MLVLTLNVCAYGSALSPLHSLILALFVYHEPVRNQTDGMPACLYDTRFPVLIS